MAKSYNKPLRSRNRTRFAPRPGTKIQLELPEQTTEPVIVKPIYQVDPPEVQEAPQVTTPPPVIKTKKGAKPQVIEPEIPEAEPERIPDLLDLSSYDNIKLECVTIDPEMAQKMLDNAFRNRGLTRLRVIRYARDMSAGHWRPSPDGAICFNPDGKLLNGQHRLNALIRAGIPIRFWVATNVPTEAIKVMDTGQHRSFDQIRTIATGQGSQKKPTAMARAMNDFLNNRPDSLATFAEVQIVMDLFEQDLNWARPYLRYRVGTSPCWGAIALAHALFPKQTEEFADQFTVLVPVKPGSPAKALNDWMRIKRPSTGTNRWEIILKTLSAIKAHIDGRSYAKLYNSKDAIKWWHGKFQSIRPEWFIGDDENGNGAEEETAVES